MIDTASPEAAFNEHAAALRELGSALSGAVAVRWDASPGAARGGEGPANPTLDTVLDPRRSQVSASVTKATVALWNMTTKVRQLTGEITTSVARWEGERPDTEEQGNPKT